MAVVSGDGSDITLTLYLGHGCGKLLQETAPGVFNFDVANPPVSPVTGKPVTTWYKPGQTWGSVFGGLAGAYEVWFSHLLAIRHGFTDDVLGMPRRTCRHVPEVSWANPSCSGGRI